MRQSNGARRSPGEKIVKDIKRATRKHYSSEEKIRIMLDCFRGEDNLAELCHHAKLVTHATGTALHARLLPSDNRSTDISLTNFNNFSVPSKVICALYAISGYIKL